MKSIIFRCCGFIAVALMSVSVTGTVAAPVVTTVTGTVSSGQKILIEGSSFGQKVPAAPLLWDNFEEGTPGDLIENIDATVGSWEQGAGSDNVFYSRAMAYAGTTSAIHTFGKSWNSSLALNETFDQFYLHFKRYYPGINGTPSNYKPYRFYGDSDRLQLVLGMGCETTPYQVQTILHDTFSHTDWTAAPPTHDVWQTYELVFRESSVATENGTILSYVDGQKDGYLTTAIETRGTNVHLSEMRIGHYFDVDDRGCGKPPNDAVVYTDDVYVDTTWSRVMICEGSTWSSRGLCEMQIPVTWSESSILASANSGLWPSGTTVYLYVIDSLNIANSSGLAVLTGENSAKGGGMMSPLFLLLNSTPSPQKQ